MWATTADSDRAVGAKQTKMCTLSLSLTRCWWIVLRRLLRSRNNRSIQSTGRLPAWRRAANSRSEVSTQRVRQVSPSAPYKYPRVNGAARRRRPVPYFFP
jgi:hypothetical protein